MSTTSTQVEVLSLTYSQPPPEGGFLPSEAHRVRMRLEDFSRAAADACRNAEGEEEPPTTSGDAGTTEAAAAAGGTKLLYLQWRGLPSGDEAAAEECALLHRTRQRVSAREINAPN